MKTVKSNVSINSLHTDAWSELVESVKKLRGGEKLIVACPTLNVAKQVEVSIKERLNLANRRYLLETERINNNTPINLVIKKIYPDG